MQREKVLSVYQYGGQENSLHPSSFFLHPFSVVPRFKQTIPVDDYVLDVLMRDLIGHDQQPAAYLVYLYLYGQAARKRWKPVAASLRMIADATGLSKSAVQTALVRLRRRELILDRRRSRQRLLRAIACSVTGARDNCRASVADAAALQCRISQRLTRRGRVVGAEFPACNKSAGDCSLRSNRAYRDQHHAGR